MRRRAVIVTHLYMPKVSGAVVVQLAVLAVEWWNCKWNCNPHQDAACKFDPSARQFRIFHALASCDPLAC